MKNPAHANLLSSDRNGDQKLLPGNNYGDYHDLLIGMVVLLVLILVFAWLAGDSSDLASPDAANSNIVTGDTVAVISTQTSYNCDSDQIQIVGYSEDRQTAFLVFNNEQFILNQTDAESTNYESADGSVVIVTDAGGLSVLMNDEAVLTGCQAASN